MAKLPPAVQQLLQELHTQSLLSEEARAQANPVAHKLSRVFRPYCNWVYLEVKRKGRPTVRFCRSTNKNVAGYFLLWREVQTKKHVKRDQYDATTSKDCSVRWIREKYALEKDHYEALDDQRLINKRDGR